MSYAEKASENKPYKFKELKVYASTEWLADNRKKYRQVFDRYETTYIYAELSFYNKRFDEEDWEVNLELRCYSIKKDKTTKLLCELPFQKKVSKYDNICYLREGWGNKTYGAFWKRGTYYWEAWIEGEKVGAKYFYLEDAGKDQLTENPYIELESLSLYEGSYDDVAFDDRIYYRKFSTEETRYIYVEILLRNLHKKQDWQCELFTKFYNDARELKAQVVRLQKVEKDKGVIQLSAGCGANVNGSWPADRYTAEIIFMDRLLAVIPFEVGEEFEQGVPGVL
ncbi:MAG: AAA family ATPase, partial [Bacteroidota bacterium]